MNFLSLAHFTAFLISVRLIYFILSKNLKSKANIICSILSGCFALWNFSYSFLHASATPGEAFFWTNIASIGWCSFPALAVWLALILMKKENIVKKALFYPALFLVQIVFILMQFNGLMINDFIKQPYGWASVWSRSTWPLLYYAYYFILSTIILYISHKSIKNRKFMFEKRRARLINIAASFYLLSGTATDIILPYLGIYTLPQIGAILSIIMSAAITYSINKYQLMILTPAYAASDILSTMSDSLILLSPSGEIIEVNNAVLNLLHYNKDHLLHKSADILFKEPVALFSAAIPGQSTFENSRKGLLVHLKTKSGEEIPVNFSGSVMVDRDDLVIGFVCVCRDMREINRLQQRELEFTIEKTRSEAQQERAAELEQAYNRLKEAQDRLISSEKMAAIGQLAGGAAHEINNPMGVILGFAQSIVKRIKEDDPLFIPLKSIEREAVRCKKLIGDLLTFSRTGKTHKEEIDINSTIDEIISLVRVKAKIENITITCEYKSGLPGIIANKVKIQQVILNLSNNAIDAMPCGGEIKISTGLSGKQIEITVADTGKGMTEDEKNRIFEPFFTTKEAGKGTGLGLSLCYTTMEQHNGTIEVETAPGKGTTFQLKLPVTNY